MKVENGRDDNNNRALGVCESRRLYREWAGPPMASASIPTRNTEADPTTG